MRPGGDASAGGSHLSTVNWIRLDAALLAATVLEPIAWLVGIILVILLPVGAGLALGRLLSLASRLRRAETQSPPAPDPRPANPGRRPGGKK